MTAIDAITVPASTLTLEFEPRFLAQRVGRPDNEHDLIDQVIEANNIVEEVLAAFAVAARCALRVRLGADWTVVTV
jgi:hypothetical protein